MQHGENRPKPPILRHTGWRHLLSDLSSRKDLRGLSEGSSRHVANFVAPAACAALHIATHLPGLADNEKIRILVAGAAEFETIAGGRAFSLIPWLIGSNASVEATLVGNQADTALRSPSGFVPKSLPEANIRVETVQRFLSARGNEPFDAVFLFHPGIEEHWDEWDEEGALRTLVSRHPVFACSHSEDDYDSDKYLLNTYGYDVSPPADNPFHLPCPFGKEFSMWGRKTWRFTGKVPGEDHVPDKDRLVLFDLLNRLWEHGNTDTPLYGTVGKTVGVRNGDGGKLDLLHLYDGAWLDERTLRVFATEEAGGEEIVPTEVVLAPEDLAGRPGPEATGMERAIWAIGVFRNAVRKDPEGGGV